MKNILFIGGIHGVGKTTFCKKVLKKIDVNHYSAGLLIKQVDRELMNDGSKIVVDIDKNQDKLTTAINLYVDENKFCLLDGHFCLLNTAFKIKEVPEKTFKEISPKAIIVLYDTVNNIQNRISDRDGTLYNSKLLLSFQNKELTHSKNIAKILGIPCEIFDINKDFKGIMSFINDLI